jgi:hypothetical protein
VALIVEIADLLSGAALQLLLGRYTDGADVGHLLFRPTRLANLGAEDR